MKRRKLVLGLAFWGFFTGIAGLCDSMAQELVIQREQVLTQDERETFTQPDAIYLGEDGERYTLSDWTIEEGEDKAVSVQESREVEYHAVEGAGVLPREIAVEEEDCVGTLSLTDQVVISQEWSDDFSVPVTFHTYGADEYELGHVTISVGEDFPEAGVYEEALLRLLELDMADYRIEGMRWDGESYLDANGEQCRNAVAEGKKRLTDYRAVYEGTLTRTEKEYLLKTSYTREVPAQTQAESEQETIPETTAPKAEEETGGLWRWIQNSMAIVIAIGVIGIVLGALVLIAGYLRDQKKR